MKRILKRSSHWIALFLLTEAVFIFISWIIHREALKYVSLFLVLFTALICAVGFFAEYRRQKNEEDILLRFLETTDDKAKSALLHIFADSEAAKIFCTYIIDQSALINEKAMELVSYREYIEAWVHEVKAPLSLSTLVLNNHKNEMSQYIYARMNYIQHQINEDVERILYYARLQADHSDYKFMGFRLDECILEVFDDYRAFADEKNIAVKLNTAPLTVTSDRKVITFMLSQLFSNAVKYTDSIGGKIILSMYQKGDKIYLGIYNNGEGVPPEDAPFIFDKGFTGNHPSRQKATGMGLYLVQKYAEKLCAEVRLDSDIPFDSGFGIVLIFTL